VMAQGGPRGLHAHQGDGDRVGNVRGDGLFHRVFAYGEDIHAAPFAGQG
jgi:hypothetical protein